MKDFPIVCHEAMFALLLWLPRKLIVEKKVLLLVCIALGESDED